MNKIFLIHNIIVGLFFSACSLSPNLNIKEANYTINHYDTQEQNISINKEWWKDFQDENLNHIIELTLKNNSDLKTAYINMEQAAAQLGINFSDLLPKIDGSANALRTKSSINAPSNRTGDFSYNNDFKMGLNLSYEIDLWGKYRDAYRSGKSSFKASQYDYESARLSIITNATQMYFNLSNAYENQKSIKEAYEAASQIYQSVLEKYNLGAVGEYELSQAKANMHTLALQYNQIVLTKENYIKALKILSASDLNDILYQEQKYQKNPHLDIKVPQGISSNILLQRPDIQASLERLIAQNYLVGVARSAFLPELSLTGFLGFESADLNTLVKNGSKTWNIGGNFAMPIFHWGEIYQNLNLTKLNKDLAFINYENTLKTAFAEIRYALIARKNAKLQLDNAEQNFKSYEKIYQIAQERYDVGEMSLQDYLDAKKNWLNAQVSLNDIKFAYANAITELIKSFGGGFEKNKNLNEEINKDNELIDFSFRE